MRTTVALCASGCIELLLSPTAQRRCLDCLLGPITVSFLVFMLRCSTFQHNVATTPVARRDLLLRLVQFYFPSFDQTVSKVEVEST